jgi:hypothetical protein
MAALKWVLACSAIAASVGAAASGCDSSSDNQAVGDSGSDATTPDAMPMGDATAATDANATTGDGGDASATTGDGGDAGATTTGDGGDAGATTGDGSARDSATCTPVDASIATVAAGATWGCFQSACASQLSACAVDCTCNDALLGALVCAGTGGSSTGCFTAEITQHLGDTAVVLVGNCLQSTTCPAAGAEAGVDGGAQPDTGADAGVDAGTEAGSDSGASDSPTGG